MPETQLPTTEIAARPMFSPFEPGIKDLLARLDILKAKPVTRMVAEDAAEWQRDAKAILGVVEQSDASKLKVSLHKSHALISGMLNRITAPIESGYRLCGGIVARHEQNRQAEADRQRREREEEARKEQERQRLEEAAHLESQGHAEEAIAHLESPLPPVALPDEQKPAGKVAGVTVIETYKLGEIVDNKLLAQYFVEHPEDLTSLMEPKMNEWKRRATSTKGRWIVPGVTFVMQTETRNRG